MDVTMKEAARRIREHNRIHRRAEPRNSPIITEILEVAAVLFEKIDAKEYQPVKHGRWIRRPTDHFYPCHCSVCDEVSESSGYKFCPYCGAIMDGESE